MYYAGLPKVYVDPPSQSVEAACTVQFTATVSGVGKENFCYQWKHNGTDIKEETDNVIILENVTETSSGVYQCVVNNLFKDEHSANGNLVVTGENVLQWTSTKLLLCICITYFTHAIYINSSKTDIAGTHIFMNYIYSYRMEFNIFRFL